MHWGKGYKNTNKCWNQMIKRVPGRDLRKKKLQLQKKIQERKSPTQRWKKCNPVIKKKRQLLTESLIDKPIFRNSFICKLVNVQPRKKENNEKKIKLITTK